MEEYGDLRLTTALFCRVLDEEEFSKSLSWNRASGLFARFVSIATRNHRMGAKAPGNRRSADLKYVLLKAQTWRWSELLEHCTGGLKLLWGQIDVDANFRRMVLYGMQHAKAVHLGIGSHNLFDIAFALLLKSRK